MTTVETSLVNEIKKRLNMTGSYHDETLLAYANDTKNFLKNAGVSETILNSDVSIGVISQGVTDLWNFGAGSGKFSETFFQRAIQLSMVKAGDTTDED